MLAHAEEKVVELMYEARITKDNDRTSSSNNDNFPLPQTYPNIHDAIPNLTSELNHPIILSGLCKTNQLLTTKKKAPQQLQ